MVFRSAAATVAALTLLVSTLPAQAQGSTARPLFAGPYVGLAVGAGGASAGFGDGATKAKTSGTGLFLDEGRLVPAIYGGYGWQFGNWVVGGEADLTYLGHEMSRKGSYIGDVKVSDSYLATLRLRGGYAIGALLLHGSIGLALLDSEITVSSRKSKLDGPQIGGALGIGAEYALNNAWRLRGDLLLAGFTRDKTDFGSKTGQKVTEGVSSLRIGVGYRF